MAYKTTAAQRRASKKYRQKNRKKETRGSYKRVARMFVKKHATKTELKELENLIKNRKK